MENLKSMLKKLPAAEQEQITELINSQQKTIALHKEVIKQLNQEMDLNRIVLNGAGDGIIAVDENHKIVNLNPALADMFGYKVHQLKGQNLNVLLPDKAQKHHAEKMRTFGEQPQVLKVGDKRGDQIWGMHKTKGLFKVSIAISHGIKGNQKVYTGIVRDLTNQCRLERENEKKATALKNRTKELEGLYSLIKLREEESIPAIINKLFTEIVPKTTKYPEKAVAIIEMDDQIYRSRDEEPVVALSSKLHNGTFTFGFTESVVYGNERHQNLLDTFTAEFDQTILQVKAAELELQTERKTAMGELSTDIAHNINNGLQIIQGYAQLSSSLATTKEMKELLGKIEIKTQELGASVRGILQSANYTPGNSHFEIFKLGDLLSDYLTGAENPFKSEALRQGISVTINEQLGDDTYINGKKGEITLITQALIKNSINSFLDDGNIDIGVHREGDHVLLQVKDNGMGMSEETQKILFDPNFTTKRFEVGKALSLNTAQKIAQEHGGEIHLVKSQMGHGTTIELKLPYVKTQEEKKKEYSEDQKTRTSVPLNILWADDDIIIRKIVTTMTKSLDDQIEFAENGKLAMDMLRQKKYDVLITDIGMPVMGGWQLLKGIHRLYKDMTRVVASGYIINPHDMEASGANHLLNKPFKKEDVVKLLNDIKIKMTTVGYSDINPEIIAGKVTSTREAQRKVAA